MTTRSFALALGLLLVLFGLAGFAPPLVAEASGVHGLSLDAGQPLLFGWFGASIGNNIVNLGLGLWGLWSARTLSHAVGWSRRAAGIFALLTAIGVVPGLDRVEGVIALYGNDIWLHASLCLLCAYFGWAHHNPAPAPQSPDPDAPAQ